MATKAIQAASGIVKDRNGRLLLIRRANPPQAGRWSLPGGRLEIGETCEEAAVRELKEETGLTVKVIQKLGSVALGADEGFNYEVHHFLAEPIRGTLRAGDDAADIGWFSLADMQRLVLSTDLMKYLQVYGVFDDSLE